MALHLRMLGVGVWDGLFTFVVVLIIFSPFFTYVNYRPVCQLRVDVEAVCSLILGCFSLGLQVSEGVSDEDRSLSGVIRERRKHDYLFNSRAANSIFILGPFALIVAVC